MAPASRRGTFARSRTHVVVTRAPATLAGVVWPRLRNQRLAGPPLARPEQVVAWLGAVQSQDYFGAKWAVAQRTRDCTDADVDEAFRRGAIVRTHVLRPTWHFVAPADIRAWLALTAPRVNAFNAAYYRKAGLDDRAFGRANAALAKALQGGHHLTRDQLRDVLRGAGLVADGLRLALLIMRAELDAVICSGPRLGKQFTYAALDERVPPTPTPRRDDALVALARRYFASHGPARPRDFAWWSGLRLADAQLAIQTLGSTMESHRLGEHTYWTAPTSPSAPPTRTPRAGAPVARLLPSYDEYLVGFRDHAPVLDPRHAGALSVRGGVLGTAVITIDGRIAGSWRRTLGPDRVLVEARWLAPAGEAEQAALALEAERYGRYLGLAIRLKTTRASRGRRPRVFPLVTTTTTPPTPT